MILFFVDTIFIQCFFEICNIIFCLCSVISYKQLRAIPEKKILRGGGGGKKANDLFFYGWLVLIFFKLYGSLVFEKNLITWVVGFYRKSVKDN